MAVFLSIPCCIGFHSPLSEAVRVSHPSKAVWTETIPPAPYFYFHTRSGGIPISLVEYLGWINQLLLETTYRGDMRPTRNNINPTLFHIGEEWREEVQSGTPLVGDSYFKIFKDLLGIAKARHVNPRYTFLLPDLMFYIYNNPNELPRYERMPASALVILKALALYLAMQSPSRGFHAADLTYIEGLILDYNARKDIRMPLDIPSLFITARAGFFSNPVDFQKLSNLAWQLPPPYCRPALGLDLFLEGSHRHRARRDAIDDFVHYPEKLRAAFSHASSPLSRKRSQAQDSWMDIGLMRLIAFLRPFTTECLELGMPDPTNPDKFERTIYDLSSEYIESISEILDSNSLLIEQIFRRTFRLFDRSQATSRTLPLLSQDVNLFGLDILLYPQVEDFLTERIGRSPVPLTPLLLKRDNPQANAYLEKLIRSALHPLSNGLTTNSQYGYSAEAGTLRQLSLFVDIQKRSLMRTVSRSS